jgi:pimeloyl-ACP methyl ester carboxylesterase
VNQRTPTTPAITSGKIQLSHGAITFLECGSGKPVVFLHGLAGGAQSWMPQLASLSDRFRVIAWDAPGYGGSDPVPGTIDDLATAALEFITARLSEPAAVVGHSLGGIITLRMASLGPQALSRIVLSCTHPGHARAPDAGLSVRYSRRMEELSTLPRDEYGRRRARGMLPSDAPAAVVEAIAHIASMARPEGVAAAIRAIESADLKASLATIELPTLVVTCERDRVVSLERAAPLLEHLPEVEHVRLPGLGHAPYYENPERYNASITPFLLGQRHA